MMCESTADREYVLGTWGWMGLYTLAILGLSWGGPGALGQGPLLWAAALVPSIAIAGQLWVTLRLMRRQDEFLRLVMARRFIAAATLAFIVATAWGFLETYANLSHLPGWLIYPLFWLAFGLVSPFMRGSR